MRGVAHRRQDDDEASPAPRDFTAEAGTLLEGVAALLPVLEARGDARAAMETIILGLRIAEMASALEEDVAAREDAAAGESVVAAAYAQGLVDGEVAARQARAPGPRHAGRKRHLSPVPGIPATAVRTAAVAAVFALTAGGVAAGMHDESAVRTFAAVPARHAALHRMAPDRASVVPSPRWSPSPRPSAAAASARPVPPSAPSPSGTSSPPAPSASPPPPPAPPAPSPSLLVSVRDLDLSGTSGAFTITAQDGTVDWWVSTDIPGASVDVRQGVLSPGQEPVTITVTDPQGEAGYLYVKWDGGGIATVWVTPSAGAPAVALP